jgi:hypothetical protein
MERVNWELYEIEKKRIAWEASSPAEYERLIKELAERVGA